MRVRLILESGGHTLSKRVELPEAPAVGSIVLADRERRVVSVEPNAERGEVDVYLREDAGDLKMQIIRNLSRQPRLSRGGQLMY